MITVINEWFLPHFHLSFAQQRLRSIAGCQWFLALSLLSKKTLLEDHSPARASPDQPVGTKIMHKLSITYITQQK